MDLTLILTAILGLVVIYLLYLFSFNGMDYWERKHGVPYVKPVPIFGSFLPMVFGRKTFHDITSEIYKSFEDKKFVGLMMSKQPVLLIRDLELANQIFIKDFSIFQDRFMPMDDNMDLNSAGLQNITGERWRVLRHKLTPTLTSGKLKSMFSQIKICCDEAITYIDNKSGTDIEARDLLMRIILNIIGDISFGVKVDALNEAKENINALYQNTKVFFEPSFFQQMKLMATITAPKIANLLGIKLVNVSVQSFFKEFLQDLINYRERSNIKRKDFLQTLLDYKKRETDLLSKQENTVNMDVEDVEIREDELDEPEDIEFMSYLKNLECNKNNKVFTDQIIAGQAFTFISGGSDTIASVLSFTLYELAQNEDVKKKLQTEIDCVLRTEEFSYEAIRKMTYLDHVINEGIRLKPPGGTLTRVCLEDYKLPDTDLVIEKGTFVYVPVVAIHHDPLYFPDPYTFNPDRFIDTNSIPKGAFMPFGAGPRICIAMRLAMLEMKILLATLFSKYNVRLSEKTKLPLKLDKSSIIPRAINGIWLKFTSRE